MTVMNNPTNTNNLTNTTATVSANVLLLAFSQVKNVGEYPVSLQK